MLSPFELLSFGTTAFVTVLGLIVLFGLLTGAINTNGLLKDKASPGGFSPVRLQLLILTIAAIAQFLYSADFSQKAPAKFPEVNETLLYLLAGSQAVYLTGKGNSIFGAFRSLKFLR